MPNQEVAFLLQTAVLWEATGMYDRYGQPEVAEPVELQVRWNSTQAEALDANGNTITLDAQVVVARDIAIGSRMWLGQLSAWYGTGSSEPDDELMYVKLAKSTPDVKNRATYRELGLMRYHGAPA